eukprot:scaffold9686_cov54-Attheya_sp.AAC.3
MLVMARAVRVPVSSKQRVGGYLSWLLLSSTASTATAASFCSTAANRFVGTTTATTNTNVPQERQRLCLGSSPTHTKQRGSSLCTRSTYLSMSSAPFSTTEPISSVTSNLKYVQDRIQACLTANDLPPDTTRLVAVSKTKPVELLMEAYNAGQRRFGENYAQELMTKAEEMPDDVEWHFIGPLQSNKAAPLVKSLGSKLKCIETVGTLKLAKKLNLAVQGLPDEDATLGIYIQVNTSGEDSKSGVSSKNEDLLELVKQIRDECTSLRIHGLMTIGAPGDLSCFDTLVHCRIRVAQEVLDCPPESLELSMGMSGDFEDAIARGATSIRVGSTIFGNRDYSNKT